MTTYDDTPPAPAASNTTEAVPAQHQGSAQHPVLARLERERGLHEDVRQAATWALGSRIVAQLIQFAGVLITARLLVPEDYGKAAVVFPLVGFAVLFTNLGLNSTVIHARTLTEQVLSTAFWVNAVSGVVMTLLVCALSFPLADLFREPQLVPLLCLASLKFTLNVGVVHNALLERTLRFKQLAVIETCAGVASLATVAVSAALGAGAFSLVLGPLVDTVVTVVAVSSVVRYRPRAWVDRASCRELWAYARGIVGFNAVSFWARNADNLLLARVVTQSELGYYNRAFNLMRLPIAQTIEMMSRVMFPALSRLRDDPDRLGRAWLRALSVAVVITAPVTLLMAVAAPSIVEVLLGERWLGMVGLLQLLALAGLPQVISATAPGLLRATGATGLLFKLGVYSAVMSFAAMGIGLPWGTRGVATALLVKFVLDVPVVVTVCCRQSGTHWSDVYRAVRSALLACAALAAVGLFLRTTLTGHVPTWELLLLQVTGCSAAYLGVLALVDREVLRTVSALVRRAGR